MSVVLDAATQTGSGQVAASNLEEEQMCTLKIIRKYGHKSAGDERFQWEQRGVVVKEKEAENADLLAQAQAAFTEAMNGITMIDRMMPADSTPMPLGAPWNSGPSIHTLPRTLVSAGWM